MRKILVLTCLLLMLTTPSYADPESDVSDTLDTFHKAASEADGERYFNLFTKDAVFLGTDLSERWSVQQFKDYARPHFSKGQGWTYRPTSRHIYLSDDGKTAWFDEVLENENLGLTRGSGVLVETADGWRVAQYHLTLPVPNELIEQVVEMMKDSDT